MTVVSKELFYQKIDENFNCKLLHFWEPSCAKASFSTWWLIEQTAFGSGKFLVTIYLAKMLFNYRKIKNKKFLLNIAKSWMRSVIYCIVLSFLMVGSICLLRKLSGGFTYYNLLFYPGALSGLSLLVESKENHILTTLTFFNAFVDTMLIKLRATKNLQTVLFMLTSGFLMHLFHNRQKNFDFAYLWFYTPKLIKNDDDKTKCYHNEFCNKYAFQGFYKYFGLAYTINMIRVSLPRLKILWSKPSELINIIGSKTNLKFALFIGGYVGLFRILMCKLAKLPHINHRFHGLLSGLLSGITYMISPNVQVLVIAITTLLQVIYMHIAESLKITNHFWQRQLLFMFCQGYLLHNSVFYRSECSKWYIKMVDACTSNQVTEIYKAIIPRYFF